jgi:P27 family predicted phage terminase small subunit
MRGKKPKPTRVREGDGNVGKRKLNRSEPEFARVKVTAAPPTWLNGAAKAEWARVAPDLARLNLLQVVDVMSLAAYCTAVAHWAAAERAIEEHGSTLILRDDKGAVKAVMPSPHVGLAVKWLDKIRQFAAEFGFTPSSRGRIELSKSAGNSEESLDLETARQEFERLSRELDGDEKVQ